MNPFNRHVLKAQPNNPSLPLTHTCDGYRFQQIAEQNQLQANTCENFQELLVYLFYGRPAYRPGSWRYKSASAINAYLPCSLLLNGNLTTGLKRIAPFDTGAYFNKIYDDFLHPSMQLENFFLKPSIDMPQRIVRMFYASNRNYYFDMPSDIELPSTAFEAQAYKSIIRARATKTHDDRCSTVESKLETTFCWIPII